MLDDSEFLGVVQADMDEDLSHRASALVSELKAMCTLVRLSQRAWSPTLKTHAAEFLANVHELESELIVFGLGPRIN